MGQKIKSEFAQNWLPTNIYSLKNYHVYSDMHLCANMKLVLLHGIINNIQQQFVTIIKFLMLKEKKKSQRVVLVEICMYTITSTKTEKSQRVVLF